MKKKNILEIKKKNINNNDLLPNYNVPFAKRKADYTNNLINISSLPGGSFSTYSSVKNTLSSSFGYASSSLSGGLDLSKENIDFSTKSKWSGVAEHNSFMKLVGEMIKSTHDLNSLSSAASQSNVKESNNNVDGSASNNHEGNSSISINKNILPFFSTPVILKKISDQKKNENLNLLNPQKKLVYKIIKLNTRLVEFTTNIKKYNFNLNSFKGNNLDFILFIKNNLYYNLKYRLSNITYKIEKFVPVFKLYSLLNNINLFSPKRLLKPQPYIRFSYRLKYITKITKPVLPNDNIDSTTVAFLYSKINGRAINYLLVKLNNLANEINYIINIKNKFIKLIKFLKIINIESRLDGSLPLIENVSSVLTPIDGNNETKGINKENILIRQKEATSNSHRVQSLVHSNQGQPFKDIGFDALYLQITNGTEASLIENKIKIEKNIKSMSSSNDMTVEALRPTLSVTSNSTAENTSEIRWDRYLNSFENSVKSNPVDILYFNNNLNRPIINQYLKSMSMYNMITKGTMMFYSKFIGYNLFSLTPSHSAQSLGRNGEMQTNKLVKNIYKFLFSSFRSMYCLISKPVFIFKANKIVIQLFYFILIPKILKYKKKKYFYYFKKKNEKGTEKENKKNLGLLLQSEKVKKPQHVWFTQKKKRHKNVIFPKTSFNFNIRSHQNLLKKFNKIKRDKKKIQLIKLANINIINVYTLKFEKLCEVLNKFFKKPVELDLIRLQYPYNDSNILVRLLAFMVNKIKLRKITRRLFKNAVLKSIKKINNKDEVKILPAFLSGMTIKVAGRLMKYKVIPRKTVKIIRRGSSSVGKINYSDISRYTNKNKRGAFSITVKSGQNFF